MSHQGIGRLAGSGRRGLLRAGQGRGRRLGLACAEILMRLLAAYLRLGLRAGIYVRGAFAFGEPVVGLSDIDLVAVAGGGEGGHPGPLILARWHRLVRLLPGLDRAIDLACYWEPELEESRWTRFTYGLDERWPRSLLFPDSPRSWKRPGHDLLPLQLADLWPLDSWRRLSGPDLRPRRHGSDQLHPHLLAWAHLQHCCRVGLRAARAPAAPWAVYACVKLVTEPATILLWLEHGEQHHSRREVLQRGLEAFPEEEATIAFALALLADLTRVRVPPVQDVWPSFVRLSARIAARLSAELEPSGATAVRLDGVPRTRSSDGHEDARALGDWTALVWPPGREESFAVGAGSAADFPAVKLAAQASTDTHLVTVLHDELMVRPGALGREWFRSIEFGATDPVSAAQLDGRSVAAFPNTAGWSASHTAERAVAEHAAWLQLPRDRTAQMGTTEHLAGVFSAARAGLFQRSIQEGEPVLTLTFEATARALAQRLPAHRAAVEEAYDTYRAAAGGTEEVDRDVVRAAARVLEELGCYPRCFSHLQSPQSSRLAATDSGLDGGGPDAVARSRGVAGPGRRGA